MLRAVRVWNWQSGASIAVATGCHTGVTGTTRASSPRKTTPSDRLAASNGRLKNASPVRRLMGLIGAVLLVAALVKELSRPAGERTWQGTVARVVPYDFRVPTLARVRERLWAPEDPHLLAPQVFGVGWSVNLGRLVAMLRANRKQVSESSGV